ncbi:MAG: YceH family protein [Ottowia sp.]|uniref:YceH family protein n=1 Tax=unclassified Ottowia TaxID=2645081 RepID=UPI003C2C3239
MTLRSLTPIEARVLATLMEKARTVPDTYPLSLNGVVTGCNQKTSREPVMNVSEAEAQEALDDLRRLDLVREASGGRVARYEHNFQRGVGVPEQSSVLLGLLMLRGPQTAGELRINTERWYRFADISSVEGFLEELRERSEEKGGPLVVRLPRAPGTREDRWAHLLCGPVNEASLAHAVSPLSAPASGTNERLAALEAEVAALKATVMRLCTELGVSPAGPAGAAPHDTNAESTEIN